MEVVRIGDAKPYFPPKHADVRCLRLQGFEASGAANFSVGLSHFLPGGGAELDATPLEKVYVVVRGEVTVTTPAGSVTLGPMDSCRLAAELLDFLADRLQLGEVARGRRPRDAGRARPLQAGGGRPGSQGARRRGGRSPSGRA